MAKVIGAAPHQQLSMTGSWVDPVDAECCPVRSYTQTVGWNASPIRGTSIPTGYQVLSDTRSWMGVYVATRLATGTSASSSPPPVVMTVVPNGPAAGVLQPGDQLLSVSGIPQPSNPATLGPVIIDQIDSQQPGTVVALSIQRGNQQLTENIKLSSYANPAEGQAIPPTPGFLGVLLSNSSPSGTTGAYIQTVVSGSAASQAGLQGGDVVTSFRTSSISSSQDLSIALFGSPAGTITQLVYIDSGGTSHTVTVTLGAFPSPGSNTSIQTPIVDEI
jgi:S1-C subfamily serine protease